MCPYCGGEETHHADTEVYNLNAGQQARALSETRITLPAAFGSMTARIANLEFATFDEQDFPFWVPVSGVMSTRRVARSPIPEFAVPRWREAHGAGLEELGPYWGPVVAPDAGESEPRRTCVAGFGPASASLARAPDDEAGGYGLSFSDGEYLDGRASGAFGASLRSAMIWTSRSARREFGDGW